MVVTLSVTAMLGSCLSFTAQALTARCLEQQQQLDTQAASGEGLEASQRVVLRTLSTQLQQLRGRERAWHRVHEACQERLSTLAASLPSLPPCQWLDLVHSLLDAPLEMGADEDEPVGAVAMPCTAHHDVHDTSNHAAALCGLLRRQLGDVALAAGSPGAQGGALAEGAGLAEGVGLREALAVVACTLDVLQGEVMQPQEGHRVGVLCRWIGLSCG